MAGLGPGIREKARKGGESRVGFRSHVVRHDRR